MNPPSALRPKPCVAPPRQNGTRSEAGPTTVHRLPTTALRPPTTDDRPSPAGRAFTLVELMVATAITSLLILGMTGIFDQAMKAWRLSSRRADAEREVRGALAQIQRDLSGMVVNSNLPIAYNLSRLTGAQISVATNTVNSIQLSVANHPPKSGPQGQDWSNASVVLFFATALSSRAGLPGDLAGVGYYVTWDPNSNEGRGGWNLYRRLQPPSDLLLGILDRVTNVARGPYHINSIPEPELIGANVFNFWAQPVDIVNGRPTNMVSYASLQAGTNLTTRPRFMQLELTAYGTEQVRGFRREDWINTNNIAKFGRSFIWRVRL